MISGTNCPVTVRSLESRDALPHHAGGQGTARWVQSNPNDPDYPPRLALANTLRRSELIKDGIGQDTRPGPGSSDQIDGLVTIRW